MPTHRHTTPAGHAHIIESRRASNIGFNPNAVPPGRALELTSADLPGFRVAHRALAKSLGWTTKADEYTLYDGHSAAKVVTYWLPPVDVTTDSLSDEPRAAERSAS